LIPGTGTARAAGDAGVIERKGTGMRTVRCVVFGLVGFACAFGALAGCAGTTIAVKEKLGYAKREQLVDQVQDARDEQEEAREQFATTLEEFKALTGYDGGELEQVYNRLSRQLDRSAGAADDVRGRIRGIERVADALFGEWERELDEYQTASLRRASEEQLEATKERYGQLIRAMKDAESRMDPVLAAFNDQVLFLKHNLNARAIASLDSTVLELEGEVTRLIEEMNASIAEANAFIESMNAG
jgi:hypothetical protein